MEANRHTGAITVGSRRKNKLTFFPPFLLSIQRDGQLSWNDVWVYWCWCELSVKYQRDGELTVEMMRKSMHIYQLIEGQSQQASASPPPLSLPLSVALALHSLMPSPWNSLSLLTRKAFMFPVFHALTTPASLPSSTTPFGSVRALSYLQLWCSAGEGRAKAAMPTRSSAVWPWSSCTQSSWRINCFVQRLLNDLFTSPFQSFPGSFKVYTFEL